MQGLHEPILLDRFPDAATDAWDRLIRDVVGGGTSASALIAALDRPVEPLLDGIDVEAALAAADPADADAPGDAADPDDPPSTPPVVHVARIPIDA